jgi:sulfur carrier protein ThiS adenylyltransferase
MHSSSGIFERNVPGSTEILRRCVAGIAGCGGSGSNAAVALARAGVGTIIIADYDVVEISNLNRQYYFMNEVGMRKVDALAARLRAIDPDVNVIANNIELAAENVPVLFGGAQILIEAFDRAESKQWLIKSWCHAFPDRHIVCASGLSGIGRTGLLHVHSSGRIHVCGDESSDMAEGLCAPRVAIVANMQANTAIELLLTGAGV